ncbi:MAG: TlpA family protein disulfide reductase [Syntrophobacterales bacterium]|jgi:peroxiredoxin|nr:TlpA family protein disulfide reductase [Syntrophobacterales bacterium]
MGKVKKVAANLKNKKSAFLLFSLGLILCFVFSCQCSPQTRDLRGTIAPDFTLKDLEGKTFHLQGEQGKMVLIIFTTTWCPACTDFIPIYKKIHEIYGKEENFVMVNVDIEEPDDRVRAFARANHITYRILMDSKGEVRKDYGIMGVPSFVLIDEEGKWLSANIEEIFAILRTAFGRDV